MAVLTGAEDALGAGEIDVLLCATRNDPIRESHYVRSLVERQVDGIIVVAEWTNPRPPLPDSVDIPVVYAFAPSQRAGDLSFVPDDVHGGRLATDDQTSPHRLAGQLTAELYIAVADNDQSYPPEMGERFEAALKAAGVTYRSELYAGKLHGWTKPDLPVYDAAAAEKGWGELVALYRRAL